MSNIFGFWKKRRSSNVRPLFDIDQDLMIEAWCAEQLKHWTSRGFDRHRVESRYKQVNQDSGACWLFQFEKSSVTLVNKPDHLLQKHPVLVARARVLLHFFAEAIAIQPVLGVFLLLVDLEDHPTEYADLPLFAFQKPSRSPLILIPEIDALSNHFYDRPDLAGNYEYADKVPKAIFVGSTSGSMHTVDTVRALTDKRLNAGVYFRDELLVEFRLPMIVQYEGEETKAAIRKLGFGRGFASWQEQLANKFLISMDGNGATCSRVAIALKSNSVLLKYDSDRILFYFGSLVPRLHYIPIKSHQDVLNIVKAEVLRPNEYKHIADASRKYFEAYLCKNMLLRFTAALLNKFASIDLMRPANLKIPAEQIDFSVRTSAKAHVACVGDIYLKGEAPWIGMVGSGLPLEAFAFDVVSGDGQEIDLQYRIVSEGQTSQWHHCGDQIGVTGTNYRIQGIEICFHKDMVKAFDFRLDLNFVGSDTIPARPTDGFIGVIGDLPVESFRLVVEKI